MMNTSDDTVRVFFALWPNGAERCALACWPERLPCDGRTMDTATLHATLVFLGDVETGRLEALKLAAQEVVGARFKLCFDQARYWGHNHIVYAAPGNIPTELLQLVSSLERHLIRHRFIFDRREYKPHVTLMRNAQWRDEPLPQMKPVYWEVKDFVLLQSGRGEVNYEVLARFSLSKK
jgi:2'-5' RNA ligase